MIFITYFEIIATHALPQCIYIMKQLLFQTNVEFSKSFEELDCFYKFFVNYPLSAYN